MKYESLTKSQLLERLIEFENNEEKYLSLIESINQPIYKVDKEGKFLFMNKAALKSVGIDKSQLGGKFMWDIFPKEIANRHMKHVLQVFKTGKKLLKESSTILKGKEVWYQTMLSPVKDISGNIINVQAISFDITKQKLAIDKLRESEEKYRNLFNRTPAMIHSVDADGRLINVSDYWLQKMCYKRNEVIGELSTSFLTEESREYAENVALPKFFNAGYIIDVPYQFVKKDGQVIDTLLSATAEYNIDGTFNRTLAIVNDITQIRKTEKALLDSKLMTERIVNTVPVRIFWKDKDLNYLGCNIEFAKDAGFSSSDEIIGKDDYQLAWREEADLYRADDKQVINSGKPKLLIEEEQTTPQGEKITLLTSKIPLHNSEGKIAGILGTYLDISQRKKAQRLALESEKKFRSLLENVELLAVLLDRNGLISFINEYLLNLSKWKREEVIGKNWFDLFVPEDSNAKEVFMKNIVNDTIPAHFENDIVTKSGEKRIIKWSNILLRDAIGNVIGTSSIGEDITERKKAEEALKESKNLLEKAELISDQGSWKWDILNDEWNFSENWMKIHGFDHSGINRVELLEMAHPDDRTKIEKAFEDALNNYKPYSIQHRIIRKDNSEVRDIKSIGEVYFSKSGKPLFMIGVDRDITDSKRTEEKLRTSEERLRYANMATNDVIWDWDIVNNSQTWSEAGINLFGWNDIFESPQNYAWWIERVHEDDRERIEKSFFEVIDDQQKNFWKAEYRFLKKDGSYGQVNDRGYVLRDPDGKALRMIGAMHDVTAQKLAEEELKESEQFLRAIFDNSLNAIIVADDLGNYLFVNKAAAEMFGYSIEELLKMNVRQIRTPIPENRLELYKKNIESGKEIGEFEFIKHDGEQRIALYHAVRVKDNFNLSILSDITEQKSNEEKIRRGNLILEEMSSLAKIGGWEIDLTTMEAYFTTETFNIYGLKQSAIPSIEEGINYYDPENRPVIKKAVENAIENQIPYNVEAKLIDATGLAKWVQTKGKVDYLDGKAVRLYGTIQDITEKKKNEEKLISALTELSKLKEKVEAENIYLHDEIKIQHNHDEIIGNSKILKKMLKRVEQVSSSDTTVLILGETGSGKELVARALHGLSARNKRTLVKVNCAALPTNLIESELFGHEKGAFTGALNQKMGRFELADGGTIFLDEIAEIPLDLQSKLLRVLQEGEFERIGGSKTIKVDVRIITATNRNLEKFVLDGKFRQDLYYRINVYPITCPPLRDRQEDIPLLVNHFINTFNRKLNRNISTVPKKLLAELSKYYWPGNIRELQNTIERAVIKTSGNVLELDTYPVQYKNEDNNSKLTTLEDVEKNHILSILKLTKWRIRGINGAAKILGMKPTTLESRIKKLGISKNINSEI